MFAGNQICDYKGIKIFKKLYILLLLKVKTVNLPSLSTAETAFENVNLWIELETNHIYLFDSGNLKQNRTSKPVAEYMSPEWKYT